jgi:hypothetical protein
MGTLSRVPPVTRRCCFTPAASVVPRAGTGATEILVTLSAFVTLDKSYQARGYLNFLGEEAKRGALQGEHLRLDGWPSKRTKHWRRGVWGCRWLGRAGDVLEPYLFLPFLMVFAWTYFLLQRRVPLPVSAVFAVSGLAAGLILFAFCAVWVWLQRNDEEESKDVPADP